MADEIDQANEQAERWLNQALTNRSAEPKLQPKGSCHYCEADFDKADPDFAKKLFCDSDCSKDYEEEKRLKSRR
jgi:hypothetical protein